MFGLSQSQTQLWGNLNFPFIVRSSSEGDSFLVIFISFPFKLQLRSGSGCLLHLNVCKVTTTFIPFVTAAYNTYATAPTSSNTTNYESDLDSLPSYTIVTGLPSYDDALEQMRMKVGKRDSLLPKHPPLTSIFEQTTIDVTSEKCTNNNSNATAQPSSVATNLNYQAVPSYQVSVIVPQIGEVVKELKTEMNPYTTRHDEQQVQHYAGQQSQLVSELRRLSDNNDSYSISLPIVLSGVGGHGYGGGGGPAVEVGPENCQKTLIDCKKGKMDAMSSLGSKIDEVNSRGGSRNCVQ